MFGGISKNTAQDKEFWRPDLATNVIERYLPEENVWLEMKIPNTPSLAAFSWCVSNDKLIILGGSDGKLLNSDFFLVDFFKQTCEFKQTDFDFSTGMGHLIYRKVTEELHHIGGFNSYGVDYSYKMGAGERQGNCQFSHLYDGRAFFTDQWPLCFAPWNRGRGLVGTRFS